ncbi:adenylate/guanylate cyclase domain-containing protein [Mycobacterium malmoense]|uniref:Cyclase n=1 Tax=Mycobacterium malmoense TaxID=1780 RepID=A0ABX3SNH3_MYCMA|nr:adenylate/guanylate cyclase domain-containing protein [Mycobacterium malmoense]OIN79961.1 cyclase [Mycobacterium malmoense]ORA79972.1 cyclase [Mycobacterium malmoense]QZA19285.1 adenylate/guanylate cyclase domain-containing protein [Mycobacterium malmoense]UNB96043.1 adenylate/guanylate cyclase domain-containing protein [Mycobacterium malmoense]
MSAIPNTVYARDGDARLAYQVVGDHGPDLLFIPTATFPIDLLWDEPSVAGQLRRLASFSRLITTDLLGVGSSDVVPIHDRPAMQSWTDGLLAVLDAIGSERVSIFAMSESALPAMLLTASHPQRVRSLVLWSAFACFRRLPDYPFGMPEQTLDRYIDEFGNNVGTGAIVDILAPSWADDPAKRRWWARGERLAGGPGYFKAILDLYLRTDIRPVLASIQAPTLVLHRRGDPHVAAGHSRYLAERIPRARLVELDGDDHEWFAGDADRVLNEIESFITGGRTASPTHRVLSTVLFTDIVESTERAASLGDEAWTMALSAHNGVVERYVASARGTVVKFTGDGALATFDGPARAISCACAIRDALQELGLGIRAGLHTGEVEIIDGDVHGIAVHIAARIMALARPGEVLVSGTIPPLVLGSRLTFDNRGSHDLKGVPEPWPILAVRDAHA